MLEIGIIVVYLISANYQEKGCFYDQTHNQ